MINDNRFLQSLDGVMCEVKGFGGTECGNTGGTLRGTANMTIRANSDCAEMTVEEVGKHLINRRKVQDSLYRGWNDQMLCATGVPKLNFQKKEVYTVSINWIPKSDVYIMLFFVSGCMQRRQWRSHVCF